MNNIHTSFCHTGCTTTLSGVPLSTRHFEPKKRLWKITSQKLFRHSASLVGLGSKLPFIDWADYKNIAYIQMAYHWIIAHFFIAVWLMTLNSLASAFITAKVLFDQVFRHHCITAVIVSDQGPQFLSSMWQAFYTSLGAWVSRSSRLHP